MKQNQSTKKLPKSETSYTTKTTIIKSNNYTLDNLSLIASPRVFAGPPIVLRLSVNFLHLSCIFSTLSHILIPVMKSLYTVVKSLSVIALKPIRPAVNNCPVKIFKLGPHSTFSRLAKDPSKTPTADVLY